MSDLLAHRVKGGGPPLLLLNGGLMTYSAWDPLVEVLARAHTVVGCDFRGQLRSPGPPPARLEGHVDDVARLLDALDLPRVHVVGTSFGGMVALLLAAQHPARVASLAAVTTTARIDNTTWAGARPWILAARAALEGSDPGALYDVMLPTTFAPEFRARHAHELRQRRGEIARLPRAWFENLAGLLGVLEGLDLRPQLGRIGAPTLVVAAELDATFPPEHSQALAAAISGARLVVVEGAGHALVAEKPQALAELVQNFIEETAAAAAAPAGRAS